MSELQISQRLQWALEASQRAAEFIMPYFQSADLNIENKADSSPVTLADKGAEQLLRAEIEKYFPGDGILGEEFGQIAGSNGFQWIIDPIDGTKSFVHGTPLFGTLVGLVHEGQTVAGVCRFPALNEVVYAQNGGGAFWQKADGSTVKATVSTVSELSESLFCYTSVGGWITVDGLDKFETLCRSTRIARGWGDCYGHMLVATGRAEVMIDPLLNPWDAAALVPIVTEAGGVFVDWKGDVTIEGGNGISTTPTLRDIVLAAVRD
ncbi:MAG: histidinol-phosphatase [Planctomycetaceae bacterium]